MKELAGTPVRPPQEVIRVTIFEDNNSLRDGLFQLINGSYGFECVGAFPDCSELEDKIRKNEPDVVLMDIELPGINGIEGVRILRETFPGIRILMLTVFEDHEKIFDSIYAGASGYLLKKTPAFRILDSIREILEGGAPMSPSVAAKVLTMVQPPQRVEAADAFRLSDREKEVLSHLVKGMSYKMIAAECFISVDTVRGHIRNIYDKLHVHSKSEAVIKAIKGRIV